MKKILIIVLSVLVIVATFAGCGDKNASSGSSVSTGTSGNSAVESESTDEPAEPDGDYKIAFTSNFMGNSWRTEYEEAVTSRFEAYKEMGVVSEYTYVACNNDVTEQLNQLNALLQEDYDVIMIEPVSVTSLTGVIEEAQEKGVKIIMGGSLAAYEGVPCFMTDKTILAKAEAYYISEKIGGKGNVVQIYGFPGSVYNDLLAAAAEEVYAQYDDIKVLGSGYGSYNDADAQKEMATLLSTYGDQVDAVFCEDGMAYGIINAFQNAGKDTVPMGGDYFNSFVQYWYNNQDSLDTTIVPVSPYSLGRAIADCCVYTAAGYEVQELYPNSLDESIENWCILPDPYIVLEKDEMDQPWLAEFPNTKAMSIDDVYKLMEGKEETAAIELYCDDDYIASLFGLGESLWW
jgi:ribose transport system substrate-binding protein